MPQFRAALGDRAVSAGLACAGVPEAFSSQRCTVCGFLGSQNRQGRSFCCRACGSHAHADYGAAVTIGLLSQWPAPVSWFC